MLQHFQTKQDLSWERPVEQSVKSSISKQMKSTLDDPAIPDDVKAKLYRQSQNKFLQSKRKLVELPTVDELLDFKLDEKVVEPQKIEPEAKPMRKSRRTKKKPERFTDVDWENW